MSFKFDENNTTTTTLERPTQTNVTDLIDKRVEQNTIPQEKPTEIEREVSRFDNSHKAENLNKVYDEIDRQAISKTETKPNGVANPFFGDSDSLTKLREKNLHKETYQDVVETPEAPTIEIKAYEDKGETTKKSKKISSRMKLWISTGACCAVLLLGLIICNALAIGSIDRQVDLSEGALAQQEQELDGLQGSISSGSGYVPDGMESMEGGTVVDISPTDDIDITTSNNFFNKLSDFISYLFGR